MLEVPGACDGSLVEWLVEGGASELRKLRVDPTHDLQHLLAHSDWSKLRRLSLSLDPDHGQAHTREDLGPCSPRRRSAVWWSCGSDGAGTGDDVVFGLVDSPHLARLVTLDLGGCGISDEGARALATWPGLAHIEKLFLEENRIGAAGVRALIASPLDPAHLQLDRPRSPKVADALKERFGDAVSFG